MIVIILVLIGIVVAMVIKSYKDRNNYNISEVEMTAFSTFE